MAELDELRLTSQLPIRSANAIRNGALYVNGDKVVGRRVPRVEGIIAGNEEIFPDKMSQGTGPAFFADPKGLERQVAGSRRLPNDSRADR